MKRSGSDNRSRLRRLFGPCETDRDVVKERAGLTHVLVVAFDVTVTTERGTHEVKMVVPVVE